MRRPNESRYQMYEPPNIVRKMQVSILAAELATWEGFRQDRVSSDAEPMLEMATRLSLGSHANSRQRIAAEDALKAAWALHRMFKDVIKLDMEELERKAKSATWWR